MLMARNIYLILLLFHDRFLNFKENIGISETRSPDIMKTNKVKIAASHINNEEYRLVIFILNTFEEI